MSSTRVATFRRRLEAPGTALHTRAPEAERMLIIRQKQMDAMGEARWESFKARMAMHVTDVLPAQAAALGTQGLGAAIDRHLRAARDLGITTERDAARYIDLLLALGSAVATDPRTSWLGPILADDQDSASERLSRAYAQLPSCAPEHAHLAAWWAT